MTTFTSTTGFVFSQPGSVSTAQYRGTITLQIVAEEITSPFTTYGQLSTTLSNILRVGPGPSFNDPTPHDAVLSITGSGVPTQANWNFGLGTLSYAGGSAYILMAQDTISGREFMIPLSVSGAPMPTITSTSQLQSFLGSVTNFALQGASGSLGMFAGSFAENDLVNGSTGSDKYSLGIGDDTVSGRAGNDKVYGGGDQDRLSGDAGNDTLYGDLGNDVLYGGTSNDRLYGGEDRDRLYGGDQRDALYGDSGNDTLDGGTGDDAANGGAGIDRLIGGSGNDTLHGDMDGDRLYGGDGNDLLVADWGLDLVYGGAGNDRIYVDGYASYGGSGVVDGLDIIYGGGGHDTVMDGGEITGGQNRIFGDSGNDTITGSGSDTIFGGIGDDRITRQGSGASFVQGDDGNDVLTGGMGTDRLYGGNGHDQITLSYGANSRGEGGEGNDTLDGNNLKSERLFGGNGADTFIMNLTASQAQDSRAYGGTGFDRVQFGTYDAVSAISRGSSGITITADSGGQVVFQGVEQFIMSGYGTMTANQFYSFWHDLLN